MWCHGHTVNNYLAEVVFHPAAHQQPSFAAVPISYESKHNIFLASENLIGDFSITFFKLVQELSKTCQVWY